MSATLKKNVGKKKMFCQCRQKKKKKFIVIFDKFLTNFIKLYKYILNKNDNNQNFFKFQQSKKKLFIFLNTI
jgi:hypothetical protein